MKLRSKYRLNLTDCINRKLLHKVGKQWIVISLSVLALLLGSSALVTHADTINNIIPQAVRHYNAKKNNSTPDSITDKASQLHTKLINNAANPQELRLGSNTHKAKFIRSHFKRTNNKRLLKRSGYYNDLPTTPGINSKYKPNDKRAYIPRKLNISKMLWLQQYNNDKLPIIYQYRPSKHSWTYWGRNNPFHNISNHNNQYGRWVEFTKHGWNHYYWRRFKSGYRHYTNNYLTHSYWVRYHSHRTYHHSSIKRYRKHAVIKERRSKINSHRVMKHHQGSPKTYLLNNGDKNWPSSIIYSNKSFKKLRNGNTSDYSDDYSDVYNSDDPAVKVQNHINLAGYNMVHITGSVDGNSINGWTFTNELGSRRRRHNHTNEVKALKNSVNHKFIQDNFTSEDQNQINDEKQQLNYLKQNEDSDDINDMSTYRHHIIDWVNFYRGIHNLPSVTEDSSFDNVAQQHADEGRDPEDDVSGTSPSDVGIYYTDHLNADHNGHAGHRDSILNPYATHIGVGAKKGLMTLYFHWGESDMPSDDTPVSLAYPKPGVFSLQDAKNGDYWSYQFSSRNDWSDAAINTPNVSVVDDTIHRNVPVNNTNVGGGFVFYDVDKDALKNGHQYTVTISGNGLPNDGIQYNTKLFNLGDNVD